MLCGFAPGSASGRQNPGNRERPQSRLFEIVPCAAIKARPNLDFRWDRESPHPGAGLLFRKEAKARAVLGLAEPVHPLPHLPRQSRLFGRHFRLHPLCGGRGIRFAHRAACSNPALALRMRAMGVAPRGAMMRSGQQMRRLEGARQTRKAPCDSRSFPCAQRTAPSRAAGNPQKAASLFSDHAKGRPQKGAAFSFMFQRSSRFLGAMTTRRLGSSPSL